MASRTSRQDGLGKVNASVFRAYVIEMLVPTLQPGDVVVMDNLSTHKVQGIRDAIEAKDAALVHLLLYSPNYSPNQRQ